MAYPVPKYSISVLTKNLPQLKVGYGWVYVMPDGGTIVKIFTLADEPMEEGWYQLAVEGLIDTCIFIDEPERVQ